MFIKLEIQMYGVMIAIGILCCFAILMFFGKKYKIDEKFMDFIEINSIVAIIVGFFFAALFQGIYNYIYDPTQGFRLDGGITFIGGLIGGVISFLLGYYLFGRKKYQSKLIDIIEFIPTSILIAHAFGRIGCYFGECCYGYESSSWISVTLSNGKQVLPTHLFESAFLFILFIVCFLLAYKKKGNQNLTIYLICYGVWRFVLEYFRGDYRGEFVGNITPSQFWSIVMVISSIPVYFIIKRTTELRHKELEKVGFDNGITK